MGTGAGEGGGGDGSLCFHHYSNIDTPFSSLIHQESILQHIKFNFKKKNELTQSNTHDQNP